MTRLGAAAFALSLALIAMLLPAAPAMAVGDESLNQPATQSPPACPTGEVYNEACKACAKTCETGKVWDCAKKDCVAKASRVWSDEELYANAVVLIKSGMYREARDLLWAIGDRNHPKVLNYIGYTTRKLGDVDRGIDYYRKALAVAPDYARAREYLGEGYLQKNDVAAAKAQLIEIARRNGTGTPEYAALADAIAMHLAGETLKKTW